MCDYTAATLLAAPPIAVVGDVHLRFDDEDVRAFNRSDYGLILFVGDLAGYRRGVHTVARRIAQLRKPALVIPGNHDGVSLAHLAAETFQKHALVRWLDRSQPARCRSLEQALSPVPLCGYSAHDVTLGERAITVIAGRPHSQGGSQFAFARYLGRRYGVHDIEQSAARLCELVDEAQHASLIFLAHNGPSGLGSGRHDLWGCDFRIAEGDFGDDDLRAAIDHAQAIGKRVLAVVAGHMHHRLKGGGERAWQLRRDGVLYLNAARVPRIEGRARRRRHHMRLSWSGEGLEVEPVTWHDAR